MIDVLRAEGNPIFAGAAGENLTIGQLDWGSLHAGVVLTIGAVVCQLSTPAVPCTAINQWFADGDSRRISHDRHPGSTRWYASVLAGGEISPGDRVEVAPPPPL